MRVLVCGSRYFKDKELLEDVLKQWDIREIIHGMARGADTLAGEYAELHGIPVRAFPARWDLHGKKAGPIRNSEMLREGQPELVVAFRGPNSRGTQNMIDQAKKKNIPVEIIDI